MGFSRRVAAVPRGFEVGKTLVFSAHRKAISEVQDTGNGKAEPKFTAAIFHVWKPQRIEYVVKESDDPAKLERMEKAGITLVKVVPTTDRQEALV